MKFGISMDLCTKQVMEEFKVLKYLGPNESVRIYNFTLRNHKLFLKNSKSSNSRIMKKTKILRFNFLTNI